MGAIPIILLLIIGQQSVIASQSSAYECTVGSSSARLDDEGNLAPWPLYEGDKFIVDKQSGKMLGKLRNENAFGTPEVIDNGSHEQAYKVVTIYKPFTSVSFLTVNEFAEGKKKPFIFVNGTLVYAGNCENF